MEKGKYRKGYYILTIALFVMTLFLIYMGAMTVSSRSGMAFADWPTSDGHYWLPFVEWLSHPEKFFEHGHRLTAEIVGLLAISIVIWSLAVKDRKRIRFAFFVLFLICLQGFLGGMTVLHLLPAWISSSHATLAQICLCILGYQVAINSNLWFRERQLDGDKGWTKNLPLVATVFVFIQLLTGAFLRHSVKDNVTKLGDTFIIKETIKEHTNLVALHIGSAVLVTVVLLFFVFYFFKRKEESKVFLFSSMSVGILLTLQLVLGLAAFMAANARAKGVFTMSSVALTSAHVVNGALILVICFITTMFCQKFTEAKIG